MNKEFFEALNLLEKEKGIPVESLTEKIKSAISTAVKHNYGVADDHIVEIDAAKNRFYVALRKTVVSDITNPNTEILLADALKYDRKATVGSVVEVELETKQFGRIAAQAAKQVIRQGIKAAESKQLLSEYQSRQHDIVSAVVLKIDNKKGNVTLEIGRSEAILPKSEQVPDEQFRVGDRIKVYVEDVDDSERGPRIHISRKHPGLVRRCLKCRFPRYMTELLRLSRHRAKQAHAQKLQFTAEMKMLML